MAVSGQCPFFHFSDCVIGETTCGGKKKVFELMAGLKPVHVMQLPFRPREPRPLDYWRDEVRRTALFIEKQTGGVKTFDRPVDEAKDPWHWLNEPCPSPAPA